MIRKIFIHNTVSNSGRIGTASPLVDRPINKVLIPATLSILIVISIIDTSVIRLSFYFGVVSPGENIIVFAVLVIIYALGQYFVLNFIKNKIDLSKIAPLGIIHKFVLIIQYVLISLFAIIIVQIILTSSYNIILLKLIVYTSGGSSILLLAFIAKKFFSWFRLRRDAIVISYAIAHGIAVRQYSFHDVDCYECVDFL